MNSIWILSDETKLYVQPHIAVINGHLAARARQQTSQSKPLKHVNIVMMASVTAFPHTDPLHCVTQAQ